jgi:hypothetical protein
MSEAVNVIAVFNTIKEVKPIWLYRDGKKLKIDKINSIVEMHGMMCFHCVIAGEFITLCYDVNEHRWMIG